MKRIALFLYKRICLWGLPMLCSTHVKSDLMLLHPGERIDVLMTDYYVKKIDLILKILMLGILLGTVVKLSTWSLSGLEGEGGVQRGSYKDGTRQIQLLADDGESLQMFEVEVAARLFSEEEIRNLVEQFWTDIDKYILDKNESRNCITTDLKLEEMYGEFPFECIWNSDRQEVIDNHGRVSEVSENTDVRLTVTFLYENFSCSKSLALTVLSHFRSLEEQNHMDIQNYLVISEMEDRTEQTWILPEEWNGKRLRWRLVREDNSLFVWMATPVVAVLVFLFSDRDLHGQLEKRRKKLVRDYPEIVYKLMLYVGAGMTIRGAVQKIGSDYEKKEHRKKGAYPGYEELLYTCRELQAGVSEGAAYEHLGKRTGLREYVKLCSLLGQNLKRGSTSLPERLREETEKASGEILLQAKKLGEEAGTKLLLPMVMMLVIVMVVIMIPAFGTL